MRRLESLFILLLLISLVALNGCALLLLGAAATAGAGTVLYVRGELKAAEEVSLDRAWKAAQDAVEDMEFNITSREKDALSAALVARGAEDKKVQVKLEKKSDKLTEIRIRIGTFGDEPMSRMILDEIKERF